MMRFVCICALALVWALPVRAQGWGNLDALLMSSLSGSGTAEAAFWLPNSPDPAQATAALGVVYEAVSNGSSNTTIAVGLFVREDAGWGLVGRVNDLFGHEPRDIAFGQGFAEVTTTMPGPNDPRCCPTQPSRWRVDFATMQAVRLN